MAAQGGRAAGRLPQRPVVLLPPGPHAAGAAGRTPTDPRDRPLLDLTWDYPTHGEHAEPSAEAVLREINGSDADGKALSSYLQMKDDGSTAGGCWIYTGVYADEVNQAARRKPRHASRTGWRPSGAGRGR